MEFQTQLRVGLKDYGANNGNLQSLLSYLKSKYPSSSITNYPTSTTKGHISLEMKPTNGNDSRIDRDF